MTSNLKALEQRQAGAEDEGSTNATTKSLQLLQCPVCIDPLQDLPEGKEVKGTQCGHLFCSLCLAKALKQKEQCPTCRKKVTLSKVIKVFL